MFRSRRSGLVRRLWRCRAPVDEDGEAGSGGGSSGGGSGGTTGGSGGTSGCCMGKPAAGHKAGPGSEAELKALTHSVLKRIKEKQLEGLLQAVESRGGARSPCLLLPGKVDAKLGQQSYSLPLLLFKVFRWPDLRHGAELKRLPGCESYGKVNPELVCCNPHHMSRLCELESPPPPYTRYPVDFLKPPDSPDSIPASTETGGTIHSAPVGFSGKNKLHLFFYLLSSLSLSLSLFIFSLLKPVCPTIPLSSPVHSLAPTSAPSRRPLVCPAVCFTSLLCVCVCV
uniref:SMAD family member 7 n=1 Tax=Astyanax mexicanus TaxID=7994 RepID=A0A8B9HTA0_ASTMX